MGQFTSFILLTSHHRHQDGLTPPWAVLQRWLCHSLLTAFKLLLCNGSRTFWSMPSLCANRRVDKEIQFKPFWWDTDIPCTNGTTLLGLLTAPSLPFPPTGGGRWNCCQHWKKSHSRNSVNTQRSSREDKVRKMHAVLCFSIQFQTANFTWWQSKLTFPFPFIFWVRPPGYSPHPRSKKELLRVSRNWDSWVAGWMGCPECG